MVIPRREPSATLVGAGSVRAALGFTSPRPGFAEALAGLHTAKHTLDTVINGPTLGPHVAAALGITSPALPAALAGNGAASTAAETVHAPRSTGLIAGEQAPMQPQLSKHRVPRLTAWQIADLYVLVFVPSFAVLLHSGMPETFAPINDVVGLTVNVLTLYLILLGIANIRRR